MIAIFNTEYDRQFEVVISRRVYRKLVKRYGIKEALKKVIYHWYKPRNKRLDTRKRRRAFKDFIDTVWDRGEYKVMVGKSRKDILDGNLRKKKLKLVYLGRGEFKVRRHGSKKTSRKTR